MKHTLLSFTGAARALPVCATILICGIALPVFAQQPGAPAAITDTPPATPPMAQPGMAAPPAMAAPSIAAPGTAASAVAPQAAAVPTKLAPDETNPFSNVKPVDTEALKQQLPTIEHRLQMMESQMSTIQQAEVAMPADALGGPVRPHAPGTAAGPQMMDEAQMTLQSSTFVACVNGQALFRDTDQKPFFVDAKEANQNEAIRRIGGCKH